MRVLLHWLGLDSANGLPYLLYSGLGGDLAYLSALGILYHHLNCHSAGCWRIARHRGDGHCRKHAVLKG